jgi:hypothetical protein
MRPALDSAGHRVPRTKPTCLLHTWRPHLRQPSALVLHLHQHQSSRNLHLQYLAKNQSTQRCQSLITPGSDHPPVLEPHMVLNTRSLDATVAWTILCIFVGTTVPVGFTGPTTFTPGAHYLQLFCTRNSSREVRSYLMVCPYHKRLSQQE